MISLTLDTNCIIDLDEERPAAEAIRQLVCLHRKGQCMVSLVAVSASERQKGDRYIESYDEFTDRLGALQLNDLPIIPGMAYWDISYWGQSLCASKKMAAREQVIHAALFSTIPFELSQVARDAGKGASRHAQKKWRNAFCDRQMFWAHDHAGHDVFVSSDNNFRKLEGQPQFPDARIRTPDEALVLVRDVSTGAQTNG